MTKHFFILLILITSIPGANAQEPAAELLKKALNQAKKENKNVFVKFTASWCYWCKVLDSRIKSESCRNFFEDNYIVVTLSANEDFVGKIIASDTSKEYVSIENPGATDLLIKYGCEKAGVPLNNFPMPFWYILDMNGDLLEDAIDIDGNSLSCPNGAKNVATFLQILSRTSKLTESDSIAVRQIFMSM